MKRVTGEGNSCFQGSPGATVAEEQPEAVPAELGLGCGLSHCIRQETQASLCQQFTVLPGAKFLRTQILQEASLQGGELRRELS